ncbi:RhuM family protein [Caulobacter sp. ErkDOM-E]|uniref:RhuM family protein n=1 Tax=Caulobacter sp. ErkDOM-E TaxID=3402778 RepID=UPI003AF87E02
MTADEDNAGPVRLIEDADTGHRFLIYGTDRGARVELRHDGDALWMTQAQMAALFGRDVSVISRHIANVFEEGELAEESNLQFMQIARSTKPVALYSLDMVISVGYRVSSAQATLFRKWATAVLVRFATRGFVIDAERLKNPDDQDRVRELREVIRDIRSSEANVYAELRRICAFCQDYDPASPAASDFYRKTQAKLFHAVVNQTPSEVLRDRADAAAPNMGLQSWPKDEIRQADALVAKNYLAPAELKELNRLTAILLDIFEDQLEIGKLVLMEQAALLLDQQLASLNRVVLRGGGHVRHDDAEASAKAAYRLFDEARKRARRAAADRQLAELKTADVALPKARPSGGRREKS